MRDLSVLVKPSSHRCNIACQYCFYKDEAKLRKQHNTGMMSAETLELLVKRAFAFADGTVTFVFQGGEPTLMGLPFYEAFIGFVSKYNIHQAKTQFSMQTNGILLDERWCRFLKKNNFLVGLSFDGTPAAHDKYRVDYSGRGTARQTLVALHRLQKNGVDFNVLMVVTHETASQVEASYHFLKQCGVEYLQIIPVLEHFGDAKCSQSWSLTREDLQIVLIKLFDLWHEDFIRQQELRVTYFENIIYKMMGNSHISCAMNGQCMLEMVIEADGSVYPCDFYAGDAWCMGNLREMGFLDLIRTDTAAAFLAESIRINTPCRTCPWRGYCQGGCRRYQLAENGRYENYYCSAYRGFFDHAGPELSRIAKVLTSSTQG